MAVTLAPVITCPLPGPVMLSATMTGGGNFWRAWCTSAPLGSKLRGQIDTEVAARIETTSGGAADTPTLELDQGGAYTFACQEYTKGASTYGGGYDGSPDGFQTETKIGAESTSTIYVGQRLVTRVGAPSYGQADCVVWVFNTKIRSTTLKVHGEATPAFLSPSNERAIVACQNATALATLATLDGVTATNAIGSLDTLCGEIRTDLPNHFNNVGAQYHGAGGVPAPDTDHDTAIENLPAAPTTPAGFVAFFSTVRANLALHMANSPGAYHKPAAVEPDYVNALLAPLPAGAEMAQVLCAAGDIFARYNAHCASATHHLNVDAANVLTTALGVLVQVHRDFVAAMRPMAPTAPVAINPGAVQLIHGAGFVGSRG